VYVYASKKFDNFANIPEPVQYVIYTLALPFDLRCESGTYICRKVRIAEKKNLSRIIIAIVFLSNITKKLELLLNGQ